MFPNTCWFIPTFSGRVLFYEQGKDGEGMICADQDLRFYKTPPNSALSSRNNSFICIIFWVTQDISRSLKISQNISRSWSNGLIIKLFTNVYLFFYPFRFANDSANRHFYWLVVWNIFYFSIFFHILGIIIPTDFHIFQMG